MILYLTNVTSFHNTAFQNFHTLEMLLLPHKSDFYLRKATTFLIIETLYLRNATLYLTSVNVYHVNSTF